MKKKHLWYFSGYDDAAAYTLGAAAYTLGAEAYTPDAAAYMRQCENKANSVQLS